MLGQSQLPNLSRLTHRRVLRYCLHLLRWGARSLVLVLLFLSLPMAWLASEIGRVRFQRANVASLPNGLCYLDRQLESSGDRQLESPSYFFQVVVGEDAFAYVERVHLVAGLSTDKDLATLHEFPRLRDLRLELVQLTDASMLDLQRLPKLEVLELVHTPISDAGLEHLQCFPCLRRLNVRGARFSSDGIGHLGRLPHLVSLGLRDTRIRDRDLAHLRRLRKLKFLDLRETLVTAQGVDALQKALPRCTIVHEADQM